MIEFVWVDGMAVRVTSLVRREVGGAVGEGPREVTLVVIVRGKRGHGEMLALLAPGMVTVEIPHEEGPERFAAEVVAASHVALGQGEVTTYRHEVTMGERAPGIGDGGMADRSAAGEGISVAIRLEALIEALDAAGVVERGAVEAIARRMVAASGPSENRGAEG